MESNGEVKSTKSEKSSSPAPTEQTNNVHIYPDWATMQAYYGPRVPISPYYNSVVASGHPPHPYMCPPPQPMMPPYGGPYATIYSHGGVYAHPGVPPGTHPHGTVVPPPAAATPLAIKTPLKSMGNTDQGLQKKLKRFDGLAMSIGNGNANSDDGVTEDGQSKSSGTDGSSEGSDGNTAGMDQDKKKRSHDGTLVTAGGDGKNKGLATRVPPVEFNSATSKTGAASVSPVNCPGKLVGPVLSPGTAMPLEVGSSINTHAKTGSTSVPQNGTVMSSRTLLQNERELKRERRKQSNRESARRSRLRKQAETEELAKKVEILTAENIALKSEIKQLKENSKNMRRENARLLEKVKNIQTGQAEADEIGLSNVDDKKAQPMSTENLLARVDRSDSVERKEDDERCNKESKPGTKLHQLLDRKPRANAIAAG